MAKRKTFTPDFKAEVVMETLCDQTSQAELCRKQNINAVQLSKWKRQIHENAETLFETNDKQNQASQQRITQLEQLVGRTPLRTPFILLIAVAHSSLIVLLSTTIHSSLTLFLRIVSIA